MGDLKILFSADQIHTRIVTLAREIDAAYSTEVVVHIIGVLRGGMMFTADLVRALTHATTIDFTHLESYAASKRSSGPVIWHLKPNNVTERHVLIVEDIVTTGQSSRECIDCITASGGRVVAASCLIDRSDGAADLGVPLISLARLAVPAYDADDLPPELAATPAVKPGSRPQP